jgi:hypothetical protein
MDLFIKIMGGLIIIEGIVLLIKPVVYPKLVSFFTKGKLMYVALLLKAAIGVVFLISALNCKMPWIIITFGLLILFGSLWMFTVKQEKLKRFLSWLQQRSPTFFRVMGLVSLVLGGILIYAA